MISFTVPLLPPSVNHYKKPNGRGGWFVTDEAKAFINAVWLFCKRQHCDAQYYAIQIKVGVTEKQFARGDLDNLAKVSIDALAASRVIKDDRYVIDLHLSKYISSEPCTTYRVEEAVLTRDPICV